MLILIGAQKPRHQNSSFVRRPCFCSTQGQKVTDARALFKASPNNIDETHVATMRLTCGPQRTKRGTAS